MLSLTEATVLLFNSIVTMAILLMVSLLFGATLRNILQNRTTIEQLEEASEVRDARRHDLQPMPYPFDLGLVRNLEQFLGRRKWAWLFPLPSDWQLAGLGEGYEYATRGECKDTDWPLVEYCSKSSCSSADQEGSDNETRMQRAASPRRGTESDTDLVQRKRIRRDSEGLVIPSSLPWHHQQASAPNLVQQD